MKADIGFLIWLGIITLLAYNNFDDGKQAGTIAIFLFTLIHYLRIDLQMIRAETGRLADSAGQISSHLYEIKESISDLRDIAARRR